MKKFMSFPLEFIMSCLEQVFLCIGSGMDDGNELWEV